MIKDRDTFFLELPSLRPQPPTAKKRSFRPWQFRLSTILVLMVLFGGFFVWLRDYVHNRPIAWVPYSAEALARKRSEGRVVMVLVDANWHPAVTYTRVFAVETPGVRKFLRSHGIIAMEADWSEPSPDVNELLASLNEQSVPIVAVFPAAEDATPITLRDMATEDQVLAALQEASGKPP